MFRFVYKNGILIRKQHTTFIKNVIFDIKRNKKLAGGLEDVKPITAGRYGCVFVF